MAEKHVEIANGLSPEARRALLDTPESGRVQVFGPLGRVIEAELSTAELVKGSGGVLYLTPCGEVVREYVLDQELEAMG